MNILFVKGADIMVVESLIIPQSGEKIMLWDSYDVVDDVIHYPSKKYLNMIEKRSGASGLHIQRLDIQAVVMVTD